MLRHALRRLILTIPTLLGIAFVSFLVLSFMPHPTDEPAGDAEREDSQDRAERIARRREAHLDLPRFVNVAPRDVRDRAAVAVDAIAAGGPHSGEGARELARLGGAALPFVLPALDELGPTPRARVAAALAPVAERMGLAGADAAADPERAVAFWMRFWSDRGVEFRRPAVRSAVARLARYRSGSRAADLRELDTFALEDTLALLAPPADEDSLERARVLVDLAAHVTGRDDRIEADADLERATAVVDRWKRYWTVYRADFVSLSGPARLAAAVLETRFGKWALDAVAHRLGTTLDGRPVLDDLLRRGRTTLLLVFGGIALAYAAAVPLGALSAASRGRRSDFAVALGVLGLYSVPTAIVAVALAGKPRGLALATVVLALGLLAAPTRQQRSALAGALSQDYVRAAAARGAARAGIVLRHALRNALLPVVTLAALEAPMALGAAFVLERVFSIEGLGDATLRAVHARDLAWLMALSLFAGATAALGVLLTDVAYVVIDPRLRDAVLARQRGTV